MNVKSSLGSIDRISWYFFSLKGNALSFALRFRHEKKSSHQIGKDRSPGSGLLLRTTLKDFLRSRRLQLVAILFLIEVFFFLASTNLPMSTVEQQALASHGREVIGSISGESPAGMLTSIFGNNARVLLLDLIPVLGVIAFGGSIYSTARFIEAISLDQKLQPTAAAAALFLFAHTWMEFMAYALATSEGILLLYSIIRRRFRLELRYALIVTIIALITIFIASAFETALLSSGIAGLSTWVLFLLLILATLRLRRKFASEPPSYLTSQEVTSNTLPTVGKKGI